MKHTEDEKWMKVALAEARQGIGLTAPNPAVGAVIVHDGVELARGWHRKAGTPHAERDALAKVSDARGATIYVTLEPCSTKGHTGACTDAIIAAGISRVAYGAQDPNPSHVGQANGVLEAAGISVEYGICEEECVYLIRDFAKVQREGLPWVIFKTAMSLDGRITRPSGESQWLTGSEAREQVQLLRAEMDAIVTSGETVRRDDPALTLRSKSIPAEKRQPLRVVMTQQGLESERYQIFQGSDPTLLLEGVSPEECLQKLVSEHSCQRVLLECGGNLAGAFLDVGLIDEVVVYLAPMVTGGPSPALGGKGAQSLEDRLGLVHLEMKRIGKDVVARGVLSKTPKQLER